MNRDTDLRDTDEIDSREHPPGECMKNARYEPRIRRLAGVLGMDWLPGTWVDKYAGKWWLVGSAGGDQPLPNTGGCATLPDALDAAEAWLAPQIDLPECSICRRRHGSEVVHACE